MAGLMSKQPSEIRDASLDFAPDLLVGETLTTVTEHKATNLDTGADATSTIFATPAPQASGTVVVFWVKAGAHGERYRLTFKVTTSRGQTLEGDLQLNVTDLTFT